MINLSIIQVEKDAPVNPTSSILTSISGGNLLAALALGSKSGKLVLTKKRFRRLLSKHNYKNGIKISINNWTTGSLFESLCQRSIYCDERRSKMTMIVASTVAMKVAAALTASGLFDLIIALSAPPKGVKVISDPGKIGIYSYIAGIGLFLDLLGF